VTDRRRLIVMRHARAETFAGTDHDRRLTDRGTASAADVGTHLRSEHLVPDFALVSTAMRTRDTWTALAEAAGVTHCAVRFDEAVFTGSFDRALESLRSVPEDASTVLLVGHNPTAGYLCHFLDDGDGDPSALSQLLQGFPPAAVAVLEVTVPWAELAAETGRISDYYVGRG
jgi:phosphohistidine phosphatase